MLNKQSSLLSDNLPLLKSGSSATLELLKIAFRAQIEKKIQENLEEIEMKKN